jgi:hypothetical protein
MGVNGAASAAMERFIKPHACLNSDTVRFQRSSTRSIEADNLPRLLTRRPKTEKHYRLFSFALIECGINVN